MAICEKYEPSLQSSNPDCLACFATGSIDLELPFLCLAGDSAAQYHPERRLFIK
jgi:hypothetical protein